ncbi:hypothetical protein V4D00_11070 [Ralstonia solanacearum]
MLRAGRLSRNRPPAHRPFAAQLATWREAVTTPANITTAVLVAQLEDPSLLAGPLDSSRESARTIAAQATDPDLSLLRWTAARGLVLSAMLGLCPFSDEERARLFDRLQDDSQWPAVPSNAVR